MGGLLLLCQNAYTNGILFTIYAEMEVGACMMRQQHIILT